MTSKERGDSRPEPVSSPIASRRQGRIFWLGTIAGVLLIAALIWLVDLKQLHSGAERLSGWLVFLLMAVLPLVGAPVSLVYVAAGAKFGPLWGLAAAGVAIAFHLVASWWIAHSWLKRPLTALLRRVRFKMPQVPSSENVPICLLVALVPGVSYTAKNYLLVLGGVPFRPLFWTCLPAHFFHATLAILFGDFTGEMTSPKIIFLVVYGLVLTGLSHYVVRRLRARKGLAAATGPGH